MNQIQILQEARKLIEDGSTRYVCHAIADVVGFERWIIADNHRKIKVKYANNPNADAALALAQRIKRHLDRSSTYEIWYAEEYGDESIYHDKDFAREMRLQWIDQMIKDIEKETK